MARRYSLLPSLLDVEKANMARYIRALLANPRLSEDGTAGRFPVEPGRISIYVDGKSRTFYRSAWQIDGQCIYLGADSTGGSSLSLLERLGVLAMLIGVCGLWTDDMVNAFSAAVSRIMLESYNEMMNGLVMARGGGTAVALAFSADRQQVAARMGESWYLPNGQEVGVDESWVRLEQ